MTHPLGRIVNHDPRSLNFPAPTVGTRQPVKHRIYGSVLDQGNLGSCVLNASAHALNSAGLHRLRSRLAKEPDAVKWYELATAADNYPGQYPPDDTGTDINAAGKVLRDAGKIAGWNHAFGLDHTLGALQVSGVLLGISWHQSMFTPDKNGYVHPDGNVVGGHEVFIYGDDATGSVLVRNSWGSSWGVRGDFRLTYSDLGALLADQGDAAQFVPKS